MSRTKQYLGDSVYADLDENGAVVLTTENGQGPTNMIVLESDVFNALERWHHWASIQAATPSPTEKPQPTDKP